MVGIIAAAVGNGQAAGARPAPRFRRGGPARVWYGSTVLGADSIHVLRATPRRLRRDEYDRLIELGFFQREHLELVHGILVEMSPIGPRHRLVVDRLTEMLVPRLAGRARVSIQQPLAAWDDSEPEPDVSVLPRGEYGASHPDTALWIVEVADASLDYDRQTKAPLYAGSSVAEYWIVNLVERVVEVYTDPVGGRYTSATRHRPGATIAPRAFPDLSLAVDELLP